MLILAILKGTFCGKHYFIGCSGWLPTFRSNHCSHSIPVYVDEQALSELFTGNRLVSDNDAGVACSRVISAFIGACVKHCGVWTT